MNVVPVLIQRKCGGWIAVSPQTESIKIGVCEGTAEHAEASYIAALARWKTNLSFTGAAASTRTTAQT